MRRTRRLLLAAVAVLAVSALPGAGLLDDEGRISAQEATERRNIVFVMTDDLDERSMQDLAGITALMGSKGTTFENAYVSYSLCCPSRATFLRGQYPHNHDILDNKLPLGGEAKFREEGLDQDTVATWLDEAGYQTKYVGKYMNDYYDLYVPLGWDEWFVLKNENGEHSDDVNDNGEWTTLGGHSADVFAGETVDFIRRSSANPEPFFVMVGTRAPHSPPEIAERHQNSFADTPLPVPPNFNEADVSDKPAYVRRFKPRTQSQIDALEQLYRERLRSMLAVEDLLRRTIVTLRETGELKDTYIFFTSDNGFHMGNHRFPPAKKTPYEEDVSVPLMVRGPGVPAGEVREQLVVNNDLAPTMAELAGAPTPDFVDGRSFAPLLTNAPPSSWRTAFLEEGYLAPDTGFEVPTHKSVHTRRHVFTEYDTGERELYDLQTDPYQLQSLPQAGNEQLYSKLSRRLERLEDCAGDGCRSAEAR